MSGGKQGHNQANPPTNNAYEESQRQLRERNDEARRAGKEEVAERDRQRQAERREEDRRGDVYR
jgi:hypothetical protein